MQIWVFKMEQIVCLKFFCKVSRLTQEMGSTDSDHVTSLYIVHWSEKIKNKFEKKNTKV